MEKINQVEKLLKINFKNKILIKKALTHKSANQKVNNEKLEFLGDRVIGLVLSQKLYELYPNENEGILDKKFAILVRQKTCSSIAWSLGIQNYLVLGNSKKKITKDDHKILSDFCEALVGAIFIDKGFVFVKNFILKAWKKNIVESNVTVLDPKTKLQEYSLKKYKKLPFYNVVSSTGPKHNPIYKISVSIPDAKKCYGIGKSKQDAQQDAANKLLTNEKI